MGRLIAFLPPPIPASFLIYKEADVFFARDGRTGEIRFQSKDARTVIQAAIDALPQGGKVFIKAGLYEIKDSINLKSKVVLRGEGHSSVLKAVAPIPVLNATGTAVAHIHEPAVENLCIEGVTAAGGVGIRYFFVSRGLIRNVYIKKCWRGIQIAQTWKPLFSGIYISDSVTGLVTEEVAGATATELRMENFHIEACTEYGIHFWRFATGVKLTHGEVGKCKPAGIRLRELEWGHFANILTDYCGYGIIADPPSGLTVRGVHASNIWCGTSDHEAILITGAGTKTGFFFNNVQIRPPFFKGIAIDGGREVTIMGGIVQGGTSHGINLINSFDCIVGGIISTGNAGFGIIEEGVSNNNLIIANRVFGNTAGQISKVGVGTIVTDNVVT